MDVVRPGRKLSLRQPSASQNYVEYLVSIAASLDQSQQAAALQERLLGLREQGARANLADVLSLEYIYLDLLSDEAMQRDAWRTLERFQRVVPERVAKAEPTSNRKPAPDASMAVLVETGPALKEIIRSLIRTIHTQYIANQARESAINQTRTFVLSVAAGSFLLLLFLNLLFVVISQFGIIHFRHLDEEAIQYVVLGWSSIVCGGILGAVLSTIQRLQNTLHSKVLCHDPVEEVLALNEGNTSILFTVLSGGAFAFLAYLLFASGIAGKLGFAQGIFPNFVTPGEPTRILNVARENNENIFFESLAQSLHLVDWTDLCKLLVLAFLAGFAERLVPDALDRLARPISSSVS